MSIGDWFDRAACRGMDPGRFFPGSGDTTAPLKAICAACPVRQQCLDYALDNCIREGFWGGKSERERRKLRAASDIPRERRNVRLVAACGTPSGANRHRHRGEPVCELCAEAVAACNRYRRSAQREALDDEMAG